jgi:hypothetical protein
MKKTFFLMAFVYLTNFSFSQMTKEAVEFEIAKYTKNNCYKFTIANLSFTKNQTKMVAEDFELKFGEHILTITNKAAYYAIPYTSISYIESSVIASKNSGKFSIYLK